MPTKRQVTNATSGTVKRYFTKLADGKIPASEGMRLLSERILSDLDASKGVEFDKARAWRALSFIETLCCQPTGKIGKPLELMEFQRAKLAVLFGFVDSRTGLRKYREMLEIIGRKNGKTTLASAVELYLLCDPNEGRPQIYNVATSKDQARLGFDAAHSMVLQSPQLSQVIRKRVSDLYAAHNMGSIRALSSKTDHLDGLDVYGAVIDELAAIKKRDLYDLVKQGMSARDEPILFCETTSGFVRDCIFDTQREYGYKWLNNELMYPDNSFIFFPYELDDKDEYENPAMWVKANPGLGKIKKKDALAGHVNKAKNDPTYLPTVLTKDFNVAMNTSSSWLTFDEAKNTEKVDFEHAGFKYAIAGIDAADSIDLSAACLLMVRPDDERIYKMSMYWIPESVIEDRDRQGMREDRDGVPYRIWVERGLMRTVPGSKVPKSVYLDWFREVQERFDIYTYAIGYDPWHMDEHTLNGLKGLVGQRNLVQVRQGARTMSEPMKQFKVDLANKRIINNANPIDTWCRSNASIKTDTNGNIYLDKKDNSSKNRIDGLAAELDAYIVLLDMYDNFKAIS